MSLYEKLVKNGPNGFGYGSTAEDVTDGVSLAGKTFLLTGCNSGIGKETLRVLVLRGARVIGTARTKEKAKEACDAGVATSGASGEGIPLACELEDPASVQACAREVKDKGLRLDGIVCNAGVMALPKLEKVHGYEKQFFTNHIGHFILVTELLEQLTDDARVVVVSSAAHARAPEGGIAFDNLDGSKGYSAFTFYGQSKIANILFAKELSRRFEGTKKTANALHPGVIDTNLARHMNPATAVFYAVAKPLALKSIEQGAATQVFLAASPKAAGITGEYWASSNVAKPRRDARDPSLAKKLWEESEAIVAKVTAKTST